MKPKNNNHSAPLIHEYIAAAEDIAADASLMPAAEIVQSPCEEFVSWFERWIAPQTKDDA